MNVVVGVRSFVVDFSFGVTWGFQSVGAYQPLHRTNPPDNRSKASLPRLMFPCPLECFITITVAWLEQGGFSADRWHGEFVALGTDLCQPTQRVSIKDAGM